jgi:hypothetical protein
MTGGFAGAVLAFCLVVADGLAYWLGRAALLQPYAKNEKRNIRNEIDAVCLGNKIALPNKLVEHGTIL